MKKSLLATVAAVALFAGTGLVAAEGAREQPAPKGGAAEMNRGGADVKGNADVKGGAQATGAGEMKSDSKAGADVKGKAQTTGAGEMKSDTKADVKADGKADTKANADTKGKASTSGQASDQKAPAAKSAADDKSPAAKSAADTKAGADSKSNAAAPDSKSSTSASVNLSTEQKSKIRTTVIQSGNAPKVSRSSINFNISVGTVIPRTVKFVTVPTTIVEYYPAYRGYSYFIVDDEIIIVEPSTLRIIAVINV